MTDLKLGILLWSQARTGPRSRPRKRVDELGYDHLWTWDHLHAIFGDPHQPIFEGWTTLAAWAQATSGRGSGLLVGANTFRNPGLVAKMATTLDHISGGRAILGLGGAWFELEHTGHGIDFGAGFGERLDWLDEAVAAIRTRARRRDRHVGAGRPLRVRRPAPAAAAGPAAPADHDRRLRREEDAAHGRQVRRHVERHGHDRAAWPTRSRCSSGTATTSAATSPRSSSRSAASRHPRHARPRPSGSGERRWQHNKTPMAEVEDDDTFWFGTPEQIAEQLRPYASSASAPSSPSCRRPTTTRRSSASSARSSRSSTGLGTLVAAPARAQRLGSARSLGRLPCGLRRRGLGRGRGAPGVRGEVGATTATAAPLLSPRSTRTGRRRGHRRRLYRDPLELSWADQGPRPDFAWYAAGRPPRGQGRAERPRAGRTPRSPSIAATRRPARRSLSLSARSRPASYRPMARR